MPPKRAIPVGFDTRPSDNKVRCVACARCSLHGFESETNWMSIASIAKHLESDTHKQKIKQADLREQRASAIAQQSLETNALTHPSSNTLRRTEPVPKHANVNNTAHAARKEFTSAIATFLHDDMSFDLSPISFAEQEQQQSTRLRTELQDVDMLDASNLGEDVFESDPYGVEKDILDVQEMDLMADLKARMATSDVVAIEMGESTVQKGDWSPFSSKLMFLLIILKSLPRQPISDVLMSTFLWVLQESGVERVPSLGAIQSEEERLRGILKPKKKSKSTQNDEDFKNSPAEDPICDVLAPGTVDEILSCTQTVTTGIPSHKWRSGLGNFFYMNDLRVLIAKDFANPLVRPHIRIYPEIPDGSISEVYHANKWRHDMDPDLLTPMFDSGDRHYYVNELTQLKNGKYVIPIRWVTKCGTVFADAYPVIIDGSFLARVDTEPQNLKLISSVDLERNFYDLDMSLITWHEDSLSAGFPSRMPNRLRDLADGDLLYTSLVDLFFDDVSGNRSKSWNKHNNCYFTHQNLPRSLNMQEFYVHFLSTSPNASIVELCEGVSAVVKPFVTYDCKAGQTAKIRVVANADRTDNPAGSECCAHMGSKSNYLCRKCWVGGPKEFKASNEGFHSIFFAGEPRTVESISSSLKDQAHAAGTGIKARVDELQTKSGIKCTKTQHWLDWMVEEARAMKKQKKSTNEVVEHFSEWIASDDGEKKLHNPFLDLTGLDVVKDTPIEILHTMLLGIVKYAWYHSHNEWKKTEKDLYSARLDAIDEQGLSIPPIRANYIMKFANSLVGRQLKQVCQTAVFCLYDLVDEKIFTVWKAVSELLPLVWYPEISNMQEYIDDLEVAIANVLDAFADFDPTKIVEKNKLHLLAHIMEDIKRHGPLLGISTEIFEGFNAIFRYCSIFSNHLAPSRDIANQLSGQEVIKHILTGGWWGSLDGNWIQASPLVRDYLDSQSLLQGLLGWSNPKEKIPGTVKLEPLCGEKNRPSFPLTDTAAKKAMNYSSIPQDESLYRCRSVVANSGDICKCDSWVYADSPITNQPVIGRIKEILTSSESGDGRKLVVLQLFKLTEGRHAIFNMPVLFCQHADDDILVVNASKVKFNFNCQHDCSSCGCKSTGRRKIRQERSNTDLEESFIEHKRDMRYIINTSAFHNAHLLRQYLDRKYWAPVSKYQDNETRKAAHDEFADRLRDHRDTKKAEKAKKDKAKAQQKIDEAERALRAAENLEGEAQNQEGSNTEQGQSRGGKRRRRDQ